jgi:hypothetical protein
MKTGQLTVNGRFVTHLLRHEYALRGFAGVKEVAEKSLSGLSDEQLLAIGSGDAHLTGDSPNMEYVEPGKE